VALRPVTPADHQWLYELAVMTEQGAHWRLHGTVPTFDQFVHLLYANFLFLDYCFHTYSLRNIYFESLADEEAQYRSAVGRMLRQKACLKEHRLVGGEYVDVHLRHVQR
jgi:hypothetical protein